MQSKKDKALFYGKRCLIALGISLLLALLSIIPGIGYHGEAYINDFERNPRYLFTDVNVTTSITYNPFLFPFSWLTGNGQAGLHFMMRVAPQGAFMGMVSWESFEEMKQDALLIVTINALFVNTPYIFLILLAIEIMRLRPLYISLVGGIIGFLAGGPIVAIATFLTATFLLWPLISKLKKSKHLVLLWNELLERTT
jgi:hypothetical protein